MTRAVVDVVVLSGGSLYGLDAAGCHAGPGGDPPVLTELGAARGLYEGTALTYRTSLPDCRQRFGKTALA